MKPLIGHGLLVRLGARLRDQRRADDVVHLVRLAVLVHRELHGARPLPRLPALLAGNALDANVALHVGKLDAVLAMELLDERLESFLLRTCGFVLAGERANDRSLEDDFFVCLEVGGHFLGVLRSPTRQLLIENQQALPVFWKCLLSLVGRQGLEPWTR